MGDFIELGCEGIDHLVDKYWDRGWDRATRRRVAKKQRRLGQRGEVEEVFEEEKQQQQQLEDKQQPRSALLGESAASPEAVGAVEREDGRRSGSAPQPNDAVPTKRRDSGLVQTQTQPQSQARAPSDSPAGDYSYYYRNRASLFNNNYNNSKNNNNSRRSATLDAPLKSSLASRPGRRVTLAAVPGPDSRSAAPASASARRRARDCSLERQSQTSERVLAAYESERDDPRRKPESVLSSRELRATSDARPRDAAMSSHANGYVPYDNNNNNNTASLNPPAPSNSGRPRSQPPESRYYDDDYGSDYDDRTGKRYSRAGGRGYDDYYDDRDRDRDREYDREFVETERYRGPARNFQPRHDEGARGYDDAAGGAVTRYSRRSASGGRPDGAVYDSKRSRSRGRTERDRSYSRSRSGSRDRGFVNRLDDHFDKSAQGLGAGLVGAVVGGLAGREFGGKHGAHRNRDILIGAVIGGLGANAAENKWRDWKDEKKHKLERDEDRWEQRFDGRSRSAMR